MELTDLFRERVYCELGRVQTPPIPPPTNPTAARMVQVEIVSSSSAKVIEARVLNLGQGAGRGVFAPLLPGDEVLVLLPGGDPMRAVCLGGLGSAVAPNPIGNTGLQVLLQHPGGVLLSTTDGQPAHGIVHGQLLVDMAPWLTAIEAFLTACSLATTAPAIAAAAAGVITALGALPSPFALAVAASAASGTPPGVGGPPHATTLHKVTP